MGAWTSKPVDSTLIQLIAHGSISVVWKSFSPSARFLKKRAFPSRSFVTAAMVHVRPKLWPTRNRWRKIFLEGFILGFTDAHKSGTQLWVIATSASTESYLVNCAGRLGRMPSVVVRAEFLDSWGTCGLSRLCRVFKGYTRMADCFPERFVYQYERKSGVMWISSHSRTGHALL